MAAYNPKGDAALGRVINLGTGQTISIGEVAQKIIDLIGRPVSITANESQRMRPEASEVLRLQSDNRLAAELIGWRPDCSLEQGLRRTIDWIAQHLDLFDPNAYTI